MQAVKQVNAYVLHRTKKKNSIPYLIEPRWPPGSGTRGDALGALFSSFFRNQQMSNLLDTATAVLNKTRFIWGDHASSPADKPTFNIPSLEAFMNKKTHTTSDVSEHAGKYANDVNKAGKKQTTQLNQGHRSPASRSDRDDHLGGGNQSQTRQGPPGGPKR